MHGNYCKNPNWLTFDNLKMFGGKNKKNKKGNYPRILKDQIHINRMMPSLSSFTYNSPTISGFFSANVPENLVLKSYVRSWKVYHIFLKTASSLALIWRNLSNDYFTGMGQFLNVTNEINLHFYPKYNVSAKQAIISDDVTSFFKKIPTNF